MITCKEKASNIIKEKNIKNTKLSTQFCTNDFKNVKFLESM